MSVKCGIQKSIDSSCLLNKETFPQPAGVKLAEDEVNGICAMLEKQ
jgi:hypothetical protein